MSLLSLFNWGHNSDKTHDAISYERFVIDTAARIYAARCSPTVSTPGDYFAAWAEAEELARQMPNAFNRGMIE